jgi:small subunit ribosomal protein S8e
MARSQHKSKRSPTGAKYKASRKKKQYELGREPTLTFLAKRKLKRIRELGGHIKKVLLSEETANVVDPKTKKAFKAKIKNVVENPANRNYVRRNILTKGTIVMTEKGKAKITSRPGQEGTVNAILIE